VIALRLTHPGLDFWIDVRFLELDGRWLAVADLAGSPEIAVSTEQDLALLFALWPLGPAVATRLVARVYQGVGAYRLETGAR